MLSDPGYLVFVSVCALAAVTVVVTAAAALLAPEDPT